MQPISVLHHTKDINMVVRVAVKNGDKYLVVQEGKPECYGKWAFVGGKLDMGESLTTAAVREVKEETGVDIALTGILGVRHGLWEDRPGLTLEVYFLGSVVTLPDQYQTSAEILAITWKTLDELQGLKDKDELRNPSQAAIIDFLALDNYLPLDHLLENNSVSAMAV